MPFHYTKTGEVNITDTCIDKFRQYYRMRVSWKTHASGYTAVSVPFNLSGTLDRIEMGHNDSGYSTYYNVTLLDQWGIDSLYGAGMYTRYQTGRSYPLFTYNAARKLPVIVDGKHYWRIQSISASTYGYLDLYYYKAVVFKSEWQDEGDQKGFLAQPNPTSSTARPIAYVGAPARLIRVTSQVAGSSTPTVTFNIQQRDRTNSTTSGTALLVSSIVGAATGAEMTGPFVQDITDDCWLYVVASATSGTPTSLNVVVEYRYL